MKIREVSERYGISSDTLRYYERIGLIPSVNRDKSGIRDYSEIDVKRVEFIKCMRSAGLPIEVLVEYVGLYQQGDQTIEARKEILKEQREKLAAKMQEMQKTLDQPPAGPDLDRDGWQRPGTKLGWSDRGNSAGGRDLGPGG